MASAHHAQKSSAIYTPLILKLYDWWVLGVSNRFAWECPTHQILLPFFARHTSTRHLDVGVGTGFYPANTEFPAHAEITLLDLNRNSLEAAGARIPHMKTQRVQHDIMQPLPQQIEFDSISLFYLLHCLPGKFSEKEKAIANLKQKLSPSGILYGATILGEEANHNRFGKKLMKIYNQKGIFGNQADTMQELKFILEKHFKEVDVQRHGKVALFRGKGLHA
ncbi:MAG TPA: methyltransferase domain-containing protein [Rickettsiales bacterium]|nr:methyltransferase domain-containing protein [Rickettsiales bacterium]